ncbi:MAG TPA: arsenate reductase ArsC [Vicinamibacteria bacterium]|nr:arsenate reductase ArsC [Vicinamibacteria bacterium]
MPRRRKQLSRAVWRASHSVWPSAAEALRGMAGRAISTIVPERDPSRRTVQRVIFACMHNAGRSQMAAAFFNEIADPERARAISAGTRAGRTVDPKVREAMKEAGIDLGEPLSRQLNACVAMAAGNLVTMGCDDEVPFYAGVRTEDWPIGDPRGQDMDRVRAIRDGIQSRVKAMVEARGWARGRRSDRPA